MRATRRAPVADKRPSGGAGIWQGETIRSALVRSMDWKLVLTSSAFSAILVFFANIGKDWVLARRDAKFVALYVAMTLEEYAEKCVSWVSDIDNYESSGGHAGKPHTSVPDMPDLREKVPWKALGMRDTTRVLSFGLEVVSVSSMIASTWEFGDPDDAVTEAYEYSTELARKAFELAADVRKSWSLATQHNPNPEWDPKAWLEERWQKILTRRIARRKRDEAFLAELNMGRPKPADPSQEAT